MTLRDWYLFSIIILFQLLNFSNAFRSAGNWIRRRRREAATALLSNQIETDLRERAGRGDWPDWSDYHISTDNLFDADGDRLRNSATMALAIGLGGTFLVLMLIYFANPAGVDASNSELIQETLKALFGSASGVLAHIAIVFLLLHPSENRYNEWKRECFSNLRKLATATPPVALRNLQSPEAPPRLDGLHELATSMTSLGTALAEHKTSLSSVVVTVQASVDKMATSVETLCSINSAQGDNEPTAESGRDGLGQIGTALTEMREDLKSIPSAFSVEIKAIVSELGAEFGRQAAQINRELVSEVATQGKILLAASDSRELQLNNRIGLVVEELFEKIAGHIDEKMASKLDNASAQFWRTLEKLPEVASQFAAANAEWVDFQKSALQGWEKVSATITSAAERLEGVNGSFEKAASATQESAEHFQRVAKSADGFHSELSVAMREFAAKIAADFGPIQSRLEALLAQINRHEDQRARALGDLTTALQRSYEVLAREAA